MGLKDDGQSLVGLEDRERPGRRGHSVPSLRMLHRAGPLAQEASEEVVGVVTAGYEQTLARSPDRQRLPARDDLHPRDERGRRPIGRLRQQNLDRALKRVLRVIGAE